MESKRVTLQDNTAASKVVIYNEKVKFEICPAEIA
jgi:hypothetical protein